MSIEKIEKINFSYPKGTLQSVYDTEEMTALELAAKTSKKVDECVDMVNVVEQTAIDATAIVDIMHIAQDQFLTENNDIRQQLVVDNQDFIETLETAKTTFEADLAAELDTFETNMTTAVNDVITNAETLIEQDVTEKIDTMATDGSLADVIDQQIFTGIQDNLKDISINVKNFGAVGDALTDDTAAINAAIQHCLTLVSPTLFFPSSDGFRTTDTIYIPANINVRMKSSLKYAGLNDRPCLVVGDGGVANIINEMELRVINENPSDWLDENNIGVQLINTNSSIVNIQAINGFTIGLQCLGYGEGFAYNTVYLHYMVNNKFHVDLTNDTFNAGYGWCNENLFIGGRLTSLSSMNTNKDRYGVRITSKDLTYTNNNNNVFQKPCFELKVPTTGIAIPVLIEHGSYNSFYDVRNEGNSATTIKVLNESIENKLTTGYGLARIEDNAKNPTSFAKSVRTGFKDILTTSIFKSGNLMKKTFPYNETQNTIAGLMLISAANGSLTRYSVQIEKTSGYVEISSSIGAFIEVDTTICKRFLVDADHVSGYSGRLNVQCFDENGALLTSSDANHPYVKGAVNMGFSYISTFGGTYRTGVDTLSNIYFNVNENVKKIRVILTGGTASSLRLKSFEVKTDAAKTTVNAGENKDFSEKVFVQNAPSTGTYDKGTIIYNDDPIAGAYIGWVCIDETTNTWKGFGLIES